MSSYVIINASGQFWDGTRWTWEYPFAVRYAGIPRQPTLDAIPDWQKVVESYGTILERAAKQRQNTHTTENHP